MQKMFLRIISLFQNKTTNFYYQKHQFRILEKKIGYNFVNKDLLIEGLTHPCYVSSQTSKIKNKKSIVPRHYQRLEFLGDKVLNLIIASLLYERYPTLDEGGLSIMQSHFARTKTLSEMSQNIDLGRFVLMDKGEEKSGGREKIRNLENVYESLVGAIYVDGGYKAAYKTFASTWKSLLKQELNLEDLKDYKSKLQEWSQKKGYGLPKYGVYDKKGSYHSPTFQVVVSVYNNKARGVGKSRKLAEQNAAKNFFENFITID